MGENWFIDILLYVVYLLLGVVTGLTVWSAVHRLLTDKRTKEPTRGVPARTIAYGVAGVLLLIMVLTFLVGSSNPMLINGEWFKDTFWLKLTDMFIFTTIILLVLAAIGVALGSAGVGRRFKG